MAAGFNMPTGNQDGTQSTEQAAATAAADAQASVDARFLDVSTRLTRELAEVRSKLSSERARLGTELELERLSLREELEERQQQLASERRALAWDLSRLLAAQALCEGGSIGTFSGGLGGGSDEDEVLRLNVGGQLLSTRRSTLCCCEGSYLANMFSGRWEASIERDREGRYFLDFDPLAFKMVLRALQERRMRSISGGIPPASKLPPARQEHFANLVEYLGLTEFLEEAPQPTPPRPSEANGKRQEQEGGFQGLFQSATALFGAAAAAFTPGTSGAGRAGAGAATPGPPGAPPGSIAPGTGGATGAAAAVSAYPSASSSAHAAAAATASSRLSGPPTSSPASELLSGGSVLRPVAAWEGTPSYSSSGDATSRRMLSSSAEPWGRGSTITREHQEHREREDFREESREPLRPTWPGTSSSSSPSHHTTQPTLASASSVPAPPTTASSPGWSRKAKHDLVEIDEDNPWTVHIKDTRHLGCCAAVRSSCGFEAGMHAWTFELEVCSDWSYLGFVDRSWRDFDVAIGRVEGSWGIASSGKAYAGREEIGVLPAFFSGSTVSFRIDLNHRTADVIIDGKEFKKLFHRLPSPVFPAISNCRSMSRCVL
eukprot:CAMPEP_0206600392 /NCGR_PEP_ID=MMETSP0325_2-20121206/45777_1 /ASSEMBLY_ACC=CAM_ASM_000347 /TAXON_ID=2866 /ORGANISM="Crypthecodinium cohnii, Strain Seligo" /LENGTH=602 /DNA_ID=CAMNT_0054111705 /DNA_START=183 /DNA_END=1988 /DNA_ORIENTATION=-